MRLVVLVVLAVVVLFVLGLVWPRRSRHAQEKVKQASAKGERKSERHAGRLGDAMAWMIDGSRWVSERAAHAGRVTHDKLFGTGHGRAQERRLERKYGRGSERGEGPGESKPGS